MATIGICKKCRKETELTKHHCLPRRFFGQISVYIYICRECHNKLEALIPQEKQLPVPVYMDLARNFMKGG